MTAHSTVVAVASASAHAAGARLGASFSFACVEVRDQVLRNHLEKRLIASVAQCPTCRPSAVWLGSDAYPAEVRASGLWNSDHVDGTGAGEADLVSFLALVRASQVVEADLGDTLLLLPCCQAKHGSTLPDIEPRWIGDFVSRQALELLIEGRSAAFARTRLDASSEYIPALARYSGQPYATAGLVPGVVAAVGRGLHVAIVSGGYGLLRAEEPIQDYEAPIQRTLTVWRSRISPILRDYVFGTRSAVASGPSPVSTGRRFLTGLRRKTGGQSPASRRWDGLAPRLGWSLSAWESWRGS